MITRLLAGWRSVAIAALFSATVAASVAWEIRGWRDASLVGAAQAAQAHAEKAASEIRAAFANSMADLERQRADEQIKALSVAKNQTRRLLELQARLAESEQARVKISTQLEEGLTHAPLGDARDLGPAVLHYLERVRSEQSKR
jgi:hypothetical protein